VLKVRVKKGDKAPFAGILITSAAMVKIITDYESKIKVQKALISKIKTESALVLASTKKQCAVTIAVEKQKAAISALGCERVVGVYKQALSNTSQKWFNSPYFTTALGVAVGAGV